MLVVRHRYAWSYQETVERVADSLVLRWFCRGYFQRVPDKTTRLRWAATIRPATVQTLLDRSAVLAKQAKVTRARKLRSESTCVQTPIHHPTASGRLGDGVRVLSRRIQRAKPLVQESLAGGRDALRRRVRSARRVLQPLHRVRPGRQRGKGDDATTAQHGFYTRLLEITRQTVRQTVRQTQRVRAALDGLPPPAPGRVTQTPPPGRERAVRRPLVQFNPFLPLVRRGMHQARARVLDGQPVPSTAKVLSLCDPHEPPTRVVVRRTLGAAVACGRQVVLDEVEGGIVTRVHVLADDESACHQAVPAVPAGRHHRVPAGRPPWLVAGERRLHAKGGEETAQGLGVTHVVIPRTGKLAAAQRARERDRSWRRRYRWRAGIAGRIHSLRRDYGLARDGGWGTLASNLRHIAQKQAPDRTSRASSRKQAA